MLRCMALGNLYVVTGDSALKRALVGRIQRAPDFHLPASDGSFDQLGAGDLVITTPADCSPAFCAQLVAGGVKVIILAPVVREADLARYRRVGAEYIPMLVDTEQLFEALSRFLPPPIACSATPC